jgi:hypothetical protein
MILEAEPHDLLDGGPAMLMMARALFSWSVTYALLPSTAMYSGSRS